MRIPRSCKKIPQVAAAAYSIVAGGFNTNISVLDFDGKALTVTGSLDMPKGPSWIEPNADYTSFYTVSDEKVISAVKLDGKGGAEVTSKVTVDAEGSTHIHYAKDGLTVANYGSGSVTFIPFGSDESQLAEPSATQQDDYRYEGKTPPSEGKGQDKARCHGSITLNSTHFYTDLGSDYVFSFTTDDGKITLGDKYVLPEGFGPRHIATPDGEHLYVIGEVSNEVIAITPGTLEVPASAAVSILPPDLPEGYGTLMGGGEIVAHPTVPTTLYASNRNQVSITKTHADYKPPAGDFVAVLQVTTPGEAAKVLKHIPTKCDHIRAMKTSPDGEYVAVAGLNNAIIEVYKISGEAKDEWTLVASHEGIDQVSDLTFFPKKK